MQSLRDSLADVSIAPPASPAEQQQQQLQPTPYQAQRLDQGNTMQLCGNDDYTKALMRRVATGEASDVELAAFEKHVNEARSLPSIHNLLQQPLPPTTHSPTAESASSRSAQLEDYEAQLRLLEQQNWRRRQMVQEAGNAERTESTESRRQILIEKEMDQFNHGTPWSTWKRDHTRLLDVEPGTWSRHEKNEFERLWQAHLAGQRESRRRSKGGLAATLAANAAKEDEALRFKQATRENAAKYTKPFCDFLTENPTVFHAVAAMKKDMKDAGWTELSEREEWDLKPWGHYFVSRNDSSLIAFVVGANYEPGNGAAILAGHVDALTAKLKPVSQVPNKAGYLQLGVAPYAGALNSTWWDRDLGIGGRVHIKKGDKIVTKLVKLDWPIAKIPTLAPHFGAAAQGPFNPETNMVPIIGLEGTDSATTRSYESADPFSQPPLLGGANGPVGSFAHTQPPALVKAISDALGIRSAQDGTIVNWELELFDVQPATVGGLSKEFIYAGRIDDKLCSWAALQALLESQVYDTRHSSLIKVVGLFDDEEIGSLLRQGARGNFLPSTLERAVGSLAGHHPSSDLMGRTYANSFLVSSDVTHAVNPNFLGAYLENHAPHLNVGVAVAADSNGHMTTDSVSTTILKRCADKVGANLQVFQIRNDSRSGGTVGPMLSSALGVRAIDAGLPQLSMHSIRATTGALDPGYGVLLFTGFLNAFEGVDKEFQDEQ
ncbi:hypothetical protein PRZ48_007229 [Zasmidium cellare]|uniref:Aspartyl aminopeptidase n=1 Tax=Zasmidium cellare TaxID=395010 RepID=A0ABR0EJS3_ZASCE|nr:hypothetical protein PRZ48_007229 [Zasmidium cellare]